MSLRLILCNIVWSQHVQKFRRENSSLQSGKEPTCLVVGLGEFEQVFGVVIHVHVSLDSGSDPLQLDNELFACTSSVANTRLSVCKFYDIPHFQSGLPKILLSCSFEGLHIINL